MKAQRNLVTGVTAAGLVLVLASGGALTASAGDQHARFADQHGPVLPTRTFQ